MFQYIKGRVEWIGEDYIVVENKDIGYKIYTSHQTIADTKSRDEKILIYTQLVVREDDMSLYGFSKKEELKMFQLLMTVTGIGAKVALGILSSFPIGKLAGIILSEDIAMLTKAQGVGKKTAQRIVLELKDKIDHTMAVMEPSLLPTGIAMEESNDEAIDALVALGYTKVEALGAVNKVKQSSINVEDVIKKALRLLAK